MPSSSCAGEAFSSSTVEAPNFMGNSSRPPSPKVKAMGGLPMKTSSAEGRSTWPGQQAQMASTSRWKCMVALGTPVVPEVKASRQVSSAAVSTLSKSSLSSAMAASSPSAEAALKQRTCASTGQARAAACSSPASRASQSAWLMWPLSMMACSSLARSSGMVATAMPPAFITANQQAASSGVLGARSSTRLPGTRPMRRTSTLAMRLAWACRSA